MHLAAQLRATGRVNDLRRLGRIGVRRGVSAVEGREPFEDVPAGAAVHLGELGDPGVERAAGLHCRGGQALGDELRGGAVGGRGLEPLRGLDRLRRIEAVAELLGKRHQAPAGAGGDGRRKSDGDAGEIGCQLAVVSWQFPV